MRRGALVLLALAVPVGAQPPVGYSPGLLDTLIAIAGVPRVIAITDPANPTWLAGYDFLADSMTLRPVLSRTMRHSPSLRIEAGTPNAPDWVLAHEFAHRLDSALRHKPCNQWINAQEWATLSESPRANADRHERFAESFANAIDYIRYTGSRDGQHDLLSLIAREWYVPGTYNVVKTLLRHPIYRGHPLNRRR